MNNSDPLQIQHLFQDIEHRRSKLHNELEIIRRHHCRLVQLMKIWPSPFVMNRDRRVIFYQQQSCQSMPDTLKIELEFILRDIQHIMIDILERSKIE